MLLLGLNSLQAQIRDGYPSTGNVIKADTNVVIPISYIRNANVKLTERLYLLEINKQQDSIILSYNDYINNQNIIINDFQNRLANTDRLNKEMEKDIKKYKNTMTIIGCAAGAALIGLIVGLIIK